MSEVHDSYEFRGVTYTREARWKVEAPTKGEGAFTPAERIRLRAFRDALPIARRRQEDAPRMTP